MATYQSDYARGIKPMPIPTSQEMVTVLVALPVTVDQQLLNDVYDMCYLPENCVLVDAKFAATDVDTNASPAHAMSFGFLNAAGTDIDGTALQTGIQVGRTGSVARLTPILATLLSATNGSTRRKLGYKVTTAAATPAAGTIYLEVTYRAAVYGM